MNQGYKLGFRFDLLGLSTEEKPTGKMNDGTPLQDGTSYYEVDTMNFYLYYKGTWYLQGGENE